MQKVAKERLAVFKPRKLTPPAGPNLESLEFLHYLIELKENSLFSDLGLKLMKVARGQLYVMSGNLLTTITVLIQLSLIILLNNYEEVKAALRGL